MIELLKAIFLGAVQGLSEFLPISSSAHLVIFENLLRLDSSDMVLNIALHLGTVTAVFFYYGPEIWNLLCKSAVALFQMGNQNLKENPEFQMAVHVILACIPTAIIGFVFKHEFEDMFGSMRNSSLQLFITAAILFSSRWFSKAAGGKPIDWKRALLIGLAQGISIVPGISRSGITIVAALWCGVSREESVKFSFFLAIPSILGAALLEAFDYRASQFSYSAIAAGTVVSFIVGWLSIVFLLRVMRKGELYKFAYYCVLAGTFGFAASFFL